MVELGFVVDVDSYRGIVSEFKTLGMDGDAYAFGGFYRGEMGFQGNGVEKVVKEVVESFVRGEVLNRLVDVVGGHLSSDFVVRVLLGLHESPLVALRAFRWFSDGGCGFEHDSVSYNMILRVIAKCDCLEEFWSMIKEMKSKGFEIDLDTYMRIFRRLKKKKMLKDAVVLSEDMMDGPYRPSIDEVSLFLRSIAGVQDPDMDLVFRVVKKYEEAGGSLSKSVYDGIHRSMASAGRFDEAENIIEVMRNNGYEPDNVTYSQLIFGLGKAGRVEDARKVLDVMEANGCGPDIKTFTTLIQAHCSSDSEIDMALDYFENLLKKNFVVDANLLDALVKGLIKHKRIDSAYKLLVETVDKSNVRLTPWQTTDKNLIETLVGEKKVEEALNLLNMMKKHNYRYLPEPCIQYIGKHGTVKNAIDFLKASSVMESTSISAYLHVFKSFFKEGRHSEAYDLLYKCPIHVRKHQGICNLFGYVQKGNTRVA